MLSLKYRRLSDYLKKQGSVAVAFSGGVDSSVLAAVAFRALGSKAIAITLDSPTMARSELRLSRALARSIGIRHVVVKHTELSNKKFVSNPRDRCYYCKSEMVKVLRKVAAELGLDAVIEGTNADDLHGHRPGYKALKEKGILSPFAELGFTKRDIRGLSRKLNLPISEKPPNACLSSRIPYGSRITRKKLDLIQKAEDYVRRLGVGQLRVRMHGDVARIEVDEKEFAVVLKNRTKIAERLRKLGFKHVALDLSGYRAGSMN